MHSYEQEKWRKWWMRRIEIKWGGKRFSNDIWLLAGASASSEWASIICACRLSSMHVKYWIEFCVGFFRIILFRHHISLWLGLLILIDKKIPIIFCHLANFLLDKFNTFLSIEMTRNMGIELNQRKCDVFLCLWIKELNWMKIRWTIISCFNLFGDMIK